MTTVDYGTQLFLDGAHADTAALTDADVAADLLLRLTATVEQDEATEAVSERVVILQGSAGGHSAAFVHGETSGVIHTFPDLRVVTLNAFSPRALDLTGAIRLFREAYRVGRYRSTVREFGRELPRHGEELRAVLEGERAFARLRLEPPPEVTL